MGKQEHLTEAHACFAEVLRLSREAELKAIAAERSSVRIAGHIERLIDFDRLLYEHALDTWKEEGDFHFAAFFAAAGSEFSREIMALHSIWRRKQGQSESNDSA